LFAELLYVYVFPEMSSFPGKPVFTESVVSGIFFETSLHVEIQANYTYPYSIEYCCSQVQSPTRQTHCSGTQLLRFFL